MSTPGESTVPTFEHAGMAVRDWGDFTLITWPTTIDAQRAFSLSASVIELVAPVDDGARLTVSRPVDPYATFRADQLADIERTVVDDARYMQADLEDRYFWWLYRGDMGYVIDKRSPIGDTVLPLIEETIAETTPLEAVHFVFGVAELAHANNR